MRDLTNQIRKQPNYPALVNDPWGTGGHASLFCVEFSIIENAKEAVIDEPQRSKPTTTGEKTPEKGEEQGCKWRRTRKEDH